MCTGLGKLPDEVGRMRMSQVNRILAAWAHSPPQHIAVRQLRDIVIVAFGGKPPSDRPKRVVTAEEFAAATGLKLPKPEVSGG